METYRSTQRLNPVAFNAPQVSSKGHLAVRKHVARFFWSGSFLDLVPFKGSNQGYPKTVIFVKKIKFSNFYFRGRCCVGLAFSSGFLSGRNGISTGNYIEKVFRKYFRGNIFEIFEIV